MGPFSSNFQDGQAITAAAERWNESNKRRAMNQDWKSNYCTNCGRKIEVMIFRQSGFCCDNCRAEANGEQMTPS